MKHTPGEAEKVNAFRNVNMKCKREVMKQKIFTYKRSREVKPITVAFIIWLADYRYRWYTNNKNRNRNWESLNNNHKH